MESKSTSMHPKTRSDLGPGLSSSKNLHRYKNQKDGCLVPSNVPDNPNLEVWALAQSEIRPGMAAEKRKLWHWGQEGKVHQRLHLVVTAFRTNTMRAFSPLRETTVVYFALSADACTESLERMLREEYPEWRPEPYIVCTSDASDRLVHLVLEMDQVMETSLKSQYFLHRCELVLEQCMQREEVEGLAKKKDLVWCPRSHSANMRHTKTESLPVAHAGEDTMINVETDSEGEPRDS